MRALIRAVGIIWPGKGFHVMLWGLKRGHELGRSGRQAPAEEGRPARILNRGVGMRHKGSERVG